MSKDQLKRLHDVYSSPTYTRTDVHPEVKKLMDKPHLAVFINGDWLPILPGMIIGLVKNRQHVDGIAPYIFKKLEASPGKEFIDLIAWTTDRASGRRLQFLANNSGVFRSGINNADEAIDASIATKKMADRKND